MYLYFLFIFHALNKYLDISFSLHINANMYFGKIVSIDYTLLDISLINRERGDIGPIFEMHLIIEKLRQIYWIREFKKNRSILK